MGVGVPCGGGCTMWGWVYHVGVGVPCGGECTMWGRVYHVGVSVPCTCHMNDSTEGCQCTTTILVLLILSFIGHFYRCGKGLEQSMPTV